MKTRQDWRFAGRRYEPQLDANGQRLIWLEAAVIDRLTGTRSAGESYSDVILRGAPAPLAPPHGDFSPRLSLCGLI